MEDKKLIDCYVSKSAYEDILNFCKANGYETISEFLRASIRAFMGVKKSGAK